MSTSTTCTVSSSSLSLNKKKRTRRRGKNLSKLTKKELTLSISDKSQATLNTDDIQYSENWRALSQELGLSSTRKTSRTGECSQTSFSSSSASNPPVVEINDSSPSNVDNCISIDCEMVGGGEKGRISMLARCSIVNHLGDVLYDKYVAPTNKVTDYRTRWSGIRPRNLIGAPPLHRVQKQVANLIRDKILVGHDIKNDLQALSLCHPLEKIRDTSSYKPFREMFNGKIPSLKKLAARLLNETIQTNEHDSVVDARTTMKLYQLHRKDWEKKLSTITAA